MEEAAELEGITYNAFQLRNSRGFYKSKTEQNPKGGLNLVLIDVSSLSLPAQRRYEQRMKARYYAEKKRRLEAEGEPPWYVGYNLAEYIEKYNKKFMTATDTAGIIKMYLKGKNEHQGNLTQYCEEFVADNFDKSVKQFMRLVKRYNEAAVWAEICECEDGRNHDYFKILALCSPPKEGKAINMTNEIIADIENLWAQKPHHENNQSVKMLYEDLVEILKARGSEYIPAYNTVRRYCNKLTGENKDAIALLKGGVRGFKHDAMHKGLRDIKSLRVMEMVQVDSHIFDCWIKYTKKNGTITALRPYLVGFIDMRSRCLVGWSICIQPNSEVIEQTVLQMIYPKKDNNIYGVPRVLLLDNGKDFTAKVLTGRNRKERFDISQSLQGFYKSVGIEFDKRALPYQSWTKAQIERVFGTICERFSKRFPSYTGTLTGSRTDAKVAKNISEMLAKNELPDLEAFSSMFEVWLEDYHNSEHDGLRKQGEKIPIPYEVFINAERYIKAAPPLDYCIAMLGQKEIRTVYNYGINVGGIEYFSEDLNRYQGEKIIVRYTRYNKEYVSCQTMDGKQICIAYQLQKLNPLAEYDDEALNEHIRTQNRQLRRVRDDIQRLQTPYIEREMQTSEQLENADKVVSIPQDQAYRERIKEAARRIKNGESKNQNDEKKQQGLSDFLRKQGETALRKIAEG